MGFDEALISVPRDRAAQIAGLTTRQINYWAQHNVAGPTVEHSVTGGRLTRLYDYPDLMSLLIAAEMRRRRVSLQHIRHVVDHLRSRGYARPLTELRFAILAGQIYFQHPDGTWEHDVRPDQVVIHEVLDLEPLRARIAAGIQRPEEDAGRIETRTGTLGSKQVFAGTRVPVETVVRYLQAGRSAAQIIESFPALTMADVETAVALARTVA